MMACVRKLGDGAFRVDWRDRAGNRYRKTFELKKEAENFLADIKVQMKSGTYVAPKQVPTLREVGEQWYANKQGQKLRPSSLSAYRAMLDLHILKADFADQRLDRIGVADIVGFRNQVAAKRTRRDRNRTFSAKMVNFILRDLESVFTYAVKSRVAAWNPVTCVDRLKQGSEEHRQDGTAPRADKAVTEGEVLSPAECRRLIDAAPEGLAKIFLLVATMTGARHSELLALKWSDIDHDAGTIHIRRSLSWARIPGEPYRPRFFDTKTGRSGNRVLPCPAELRLALKKWRLQCPKGELDLLFPTPDGGLRHRSHTFRQILHPAAKAAGITRPFHVHTLRHSFCSALLAQGTPPTEVQRYSGHKQLSMLLDVYSHFIPSEQTGALDRLATRVFG
jgi:integrase